MTDKPGQMIPAPNALKLKVGGRFGGIDPSAIAKAEAALKSLSANFADDHVMLEQGMVVYDALYTWCRSLQSETHNWPAKTPATQAARA